MDDLNIVELDGSEFKSYLDLYDNMKTVNDIKERLSEVKPIIYVEYLPELDRSKYLGYIEALEWVLNGSETKEEKLERISNIGIENYIREENEKYKQMTIEDYGVDSNE